MSGLLDVEGGTVLPMVWMHPPLKGKKADVSIQGIVTRAILYHTITHMIRTVH